MSKKEKHDDDEKIKDFKKALKNFISLLSEYKYSFIISIVCNTISTLLVVTIPWISGIAIDDIVIIMTDKSITDKWSNILDKITQPVIILSIIAVLIFVLSYIQEYLSAVVGEKVALSLWEKLSQKLTRLPINFYDTTPVGELLSKVTTDIEKVAEVIVSGFTRLVYSFLIIVLVIVMLLHINLKLSVIILTILFISGLVTVTLSGVTQRIFARNMSTLSDLSAITEEALTGNLVIQSYNKQEDILQKLDDCQYDVFNQRPKLGWKDWLRIVKKAVF